MTKRLPMTQVRDELTSLPERLAEEPATVVVTRRGEPVLAILSWEQYEGLLETLEILADDELMAVLRKSLEEAERGETIPWEQVKSELDL
jgi:prevent-host-death family protein